MLKEQHIPLSVGKVEKIAEQGTGVSFHWQYFNVVSINNFKLLTISQEIRSLSVKLDLWTKAAMKKSLSNPHYYIISFN
jgi:hypothetical protein